MNISCIDHSNNIVQEKIDIEYTKNKIKHEVFELGQLPLISGYLDIKNSHLTNPNMHKVENLEGLKAIM